MKKTIPIAWCVEWGRIVTPQDILKHRVECEVEEEREALSFRCPECRRSLTFQPRVRGIVSQGYFVRRTGECHGACIAKLAHKRLTPKDVLRFQQFETSFASAEKAAQLLQNDLDQCRKILSELSLNLNQLDHPSLDILEESLCEITHSLRTDLDPHLLYIVDTYIALRLQIKGY